MKGLFSGLFGLPQRERNRGDVDIQAKEFCKYALRVTGLFLQIYVSRGEGAMKIGKTRRKFAILIVAIGALLLVVAVILIALSSYGKAMMRKIPDLTFDDALNYTLKDNRHAVLTVGIVKDGEFSYTVYGNNAAILSPELHAYEIGSLTKTFTAALVAKAVLEGKIKVDDTIDRYVQLPDDNIYPTIAQLLTHTSGYKPFYFAWPMVSNFLTRKNDFYGITKAMIVKKLSSVDGKEGVQPFHYSNFGYATLGLVLEEVYHQDYAILMDEYVHDELLLRNTNLSYTKGDIATYWDWNMSDAYLPAGALVSDIEDMLVYAQMQLDEESPFGLCHEPREDIDGTTVAYGRLDIRLDAIGMAWITDEENGIVWHNGGTDKYNSYLGFDPKSGIAVVILSNLSPGYRIPSTVLGVKLLKEVRASIHDNLRDTVETPSPHRTFFGHAKSLY